MRTRLVSFVPYAVWLVICYIAGSLLYFPRFGAIAIPLFAIGVWFLRRRSRNRADRQRRADALAATKQVAQYLTEARARHPFDTWPDAGAYRVFPSPAPPPIRTELTPRQRMVIEEWFPGVLNDDNDEPLDPAVLRGYYGPAGIERINP